MQPHLNLIFEAWPSLSDWQRLKLIHQVRLFATPLHRRPALEAEQLTMRAFELLNDLGFSLILVRKRPKSTYRP